MRPGDTASAEQQSLSFGSVPNSSRHYGSQRRWESAFKGRVWANRQTLSVRIITWTGGSFCFKSQWKKAGNTTPGSLSQAFPAVGNTSISNACNGLLKAIYMKNPACISSRPFIHCKIQFGPCILAGRKYWENYNYKDSVATSPKAWMAMGI